MKLEIKTFPDEILRKQAEEVDKITPEVLKLIDDMAETMYEAPGYGLAAPQVGISKRIVVADDTAGKEVGRFRAYINPEIIEQEGEQIEEEGCLSIPGEYAFVKRSFKVKVKFLDKSGQEKAINAEGTLARILQHEIDHLDGELFIDRLPSLKRETIKKHIRKRIHVGDYTVTSDKKQK